MLFFERIEGSLGGFHLLIEPKDVLMEFHGSQALNITLGDLDERRPNLFNDRLYMLLVVVASLPELFVLHLPPMKECEERSSRQ